MPLTSQFSLAVRLSSLETRLSCLTIRSGLGSGCLAVWQVLLAYNHFKNYYFASSPASPNYVCTLNDFGRQLGPIDSGSLLK